MNMLKPDFCPNLNYAIQLDAGDEMAPFREQFVIAESDLVYLDGNSLGRLPKITADRLQELVLDEWGRGLIRGWNANWWQAPARVGDKIGQLVGAAPGQVVAVDTTSINLFKLVMAALAHQPEKRRIVSDTLNFPSDLYIFQGCIDLLGKRHHLHLIPSVDGIFPDLEALEAVINEDTVLVSLSHVVFKSGFLYDAQTITEIAHRKGALVLWDLSHAAGAVPIELDTWGVDLAVGCTYKYLNGGPGAPAYLYVRKELQESLHSPIWGWWGQRAPFAFDLEYAPAEGITRFLVSSAPVLSLLAMESAVDVYLQAGMERVRRKSVQQTEYLIALFDQILAPLGFTLGSPRDPAQRGSHVSIRHPDGYRINRVLIEEMNVIPDFREPDNIRLGISPLYTTYAEIWEGIERIRRVMEEGLHQHYPQQRLTVT
jgi:kynureninase